MKNFAIIYLHDMSIASVYQAEASNQKRYGGDWGRSETTAHVEIPAEMHPGAVTVEKVDGEFVFTENAELKAELEAAELQEPRNAKLALLRKIRDEKMDEVDIMVNDLAVGDRTDTSAVRIYRQALKDAPNPYFDDPEDRETANDQIDQYADDLSDFVWAVKP